MGQSSRLPLGGCSGLAESVLGHRTLTEADATRAEWNLLAAIQVGVVAGFQ